MRNTFRKLSSKISIWAGSPAVFIGAVVIIAIWALSGQYFNHSDTWQLVINTGTTIITFLMVFLIQNTQNRDGKAIQLKLDELIRATKGARMYYIGLEELNDEEIDILNAQLHKIMDEPGVSRGLKQLHEKINAEDKRRG